MALIFCELGLRDGGDDTVAAGVLSLVKGSIGCGKCLLLAIAHGVEYRDSYTHRDRERNGLGLDGAACDGGAYPLCAIVEFFS